jgi:enterochelin esterase-like enzyme
VNIKSLHKNPVMRKSILVLMFILTSFLAGAQAFQRFLNRINSLPMDQRQAVADSFISTCKAFPLVENDSIVYFIYTGSAKKVAIAGDATQWNPGEKFTMIQGTSFFYLSRCYRADTRLDYKFIIDDKDWMLDPRNPDTCRGGFGSNSELRMGGCKRPPETSYYNDIPHGKLLETEIHSDILNNTRNVRIYLPPLYTYTGESYPLILFHDGLDYLNLGSAQNILDYLIAHKMIQPVIAVFVPAIDRDPEYSGARIDNFTSFITEELMPYIDKSYNTSKDPEKRATAGVSNGGNIALYLGVKKPEVFGRIAAQSSNVIPSITSALSNGKRLKLDFYLDIGTYDIHELIPMVRNLASLLKSRGYSYTFREINEGHSWGNWKEHLRIPLMQFFPCCGTNAGLK